MDHLTVAKLQSQLKVRLNIRLKHKVVNKNTELKGQLALKVRQSSLQMLYKILIGNVLQEVMNTVPTQKRCLSRVQVTLTVKNLEVLEYFNRGSFNSFNKLDQSISRVIHKKGMLSCITAELKKLHSMCEVALSNHLSKGKYNCSKINNQITTIKDFAELLTRDYKKAMSSSRGGNSKTDAVDEKDVASLSCEDRVVRTHCGSSMTKR